MDNGYDPDFSFNEESFEVEEQVDYSSVDLAVLIGGCLLLVLVFGKLFARFCADGHIVKSLICTAGFLIGVAYLINKKKIFSFTVFTAIGVLTATLVLAYGHQSGYSRYKELLYLEVLQNEDNSYDSSLIALGEDGLFQHILEEKLGEDEEVTFWNYLRCRSIIGVQERGGRRLKWNQWTRGGGEMWFGWILQLVMFPLAGFSAAFLVCGKIE